MRTETKTINIYKFNELSEEAKERVKNNYLDFLSECNIFYDNICERLKADFPHSSLDVQYSLSYCQGDGLNIYGKFALVDILPYMDELTDKERRTIEFYSKEIYFEIEFSRNRSYCYSLKWRDKDGVDLTSTIFEDAENAGLRNFNKKLVERVAAFACDYFYGLDKKYERAGYKYFYEVDDETVTDWAEANEYEFTEDGEIYTEA